MTNNTQYTEQRNAFIASVTPELERAIGAIRENGVSSYTLAQQDDGSIEAFADGLRVNGTAFWTVDAQTILDGGYETVDEYLSVFADDMRRELAYMDL